MDIDTTITGLLASAKGRSLDDLSNDWNFGFACHYALQVIGEAVKNLPADLVQRHTEIPWRKVASLSDRLRHEYFRIDKDILWEVITVYLTPLQRTVRRIMADADQPALPL